MRLIIHGCRMNEAYNRCLFYPAVGWIVGNAPGSRANNIHPPGSDKLTEVQLYMSACQFIKTGSKC